MSRWWYVRHALTQIDPHHTMTTGKVDIGAFRTFPADYRAEERASQHTSLPTHKAEDYGAHADRYYALDVELFTTSAERPLFALLWNEYWAHTLCSSPSLLQRMLSLQHTNELVTQLSQARARIANAGNARALLFPIRWPEPFGLVMIEAMACGTPVAAFRRGGMGELLRDAPAALAPADDVDALAAAITQARGIGRDVVRRWVVERHSLAQTAKHYTDIFRQVAAFGKVGQ